MGFSPKQIHALRRSLHPGCIRTREFHGRELSYIEGWHAIAEANRIFGHHGWDRETVETKCVMNREVRGNFHTVYVAKVRITVRAGEAIVREGNGTGEARGQSPGETHDMALKAAETDATKRALATFGKPFGLGLYLRPRELKETRQQPAIASPTVPSLSAPALADDRGPVNGQPASALMPALEPALAPYQERLMQTEAGPVPVDDVMRKQRKPLDRPVRRRDRMHLRFVASQPCLICGRSPADPHHLRFMQPRAIGLKVSDEFTVPLCRAHHRQLHQAGNEVQWWNDVAIDAAVIAKGLWEESRGLGVPDAASSELQ